MISPLRARKRENYLYLNSWKSDNYRTVQPQIDHQWVCDVCVQIWYLFHIRIIYKKVYSVCFINNYSLIPDLHIFVYGRAECASISLKCTKVKLSILNNFWTNNIFADYNLKSCVGNVCFINYILYASWQFSIQFYLFTYQVDIYLSFYLSIYLFELKSGF